jgi:ATP-dependent Clp protease ATP-binding subunit ClpC
MNNSPLLALARLAFPDFTGRTLNVLLAAKKQAVERHHRHVTPEHLLLAIAVADHSMAGAALVRLGVDLQRDVAQIAAIIAAPLSADSDQVSFSPETERLLTQARAEFEELGHRYIGLEHIVLALIRCGQCPAGNYLRERGVSIERFRKELLRFPDGSEEPVFPLRQGQNQRVNG